MKKILILTNNDIGLYRFRKEVLAEFLVPGSNIIGNDIEPNEVYISLPNGDFIPKLIEMGCKFIDTSVDRRGVNPLTDIKLLLFYIKTLKRIKPDLVFTYTIKPNIYGGLACQYLKIPYVENITGLGTAVQNKGGLQTITLNLYKIALKKAKTIFFQNDENRKFFINKHIVSKNNILLPGSGINLSEHEFEEYPENDSINLLFIGRIMRDKGIKEFLDCAEYITSKYKNVVFNVVGPMEEVDFEGRINQLVKVKTINYYGMQTDVHTFFKENHAVILPSYHEGLSNVLLEAAATGRPVIASNISGCKETFIENITGLSFNTKDSQDLIRKVVSFIELPYEAKKQMGSASRKFIEDRFERKIVIKKYLDEINKI